MSLPFPFSNAAAALFNFFVTLSDFNSFLDELRFRKVVTRHRAEVVHVEVERHPDARKVEEGQKTSGQAGRNGRR